MTPVVQWESGETFEPTKYWEGGIDVQSLTFGLEIPGPTPIALHQDHELAAVQTLNFSMQFRPDPLAITQIHRLTVHDLTFGPGFENLQILHAFDPMLTFGLQIQGSIRIQEGKTIQVQDLTFNLETPPTDHFHIFDNTTSTQDWVMPDNLNFQFLPWVQPPVLGQKHIMGGNIGLIFELQNTLERVFQKHYLLAPDSWTTQLALQIVEPVMTVAMDVPDSLTFGMEVTGNLVPVQSSLVDVDDLTFTWGVVGLELSALGLVVDPMIQVNADDTEVQ